MLLCGALNTQGVTDNSKKSRPQLIDSQPLFEMINQYRVSKGLKPLLPMGKIYQIASDIYVKSLSKEFEHSASDKFTENICYYRGYDDPLLEMLEAWKKSGGHNKTLLGTRQKYMVVSACYIEDSNESYAVFRGYE